MGSDHPKLRKRRLIWAALALVLLVSGPAYLVYQKNLQRSVVLWEYPVELLDGNLGIGVDGTIYLCTFESGLIALGSDGKEKWRFNPDNDLNFRPVSDSLGNVYFTTVSYPSVEFPNGSAELIALSNEGIQQWSYFLPENFNLGMPYLSLSEKGIILGSSRGKYFALDLKGRFLWEYCDPYYSYFDPVMGEDGKAYLSFFNIPGKDESLQCISQEGNRLWSACLDSSRLECEPVIDTNGNIILGTTDGLVTLDPSGAFLWDSFVSARYQCDGLLLNRKTVYFRVNYQKLGASSILGEELWVASFTNSHGDEPIFLSDHVLDTDGNLVLTMMYAQKDPPGIMRRILIGLGLGGSSNHDSLGQVVIIDSANGKILWHYDYPNYSNYPPLVSPDGIVIIYEYDGKIKALKPKY